MVLCLQDIPEYPTIVKHPMDFRTARAKVCAGAYSSMDEWRADMQRIWDNARLFNPPEHHVTVCAEKLEANMERRMEEAVAAAAQDLALQQRTLRGACLLLAGKGKGTAGGNKPRVPGGVALLRESVDLAGIDSDAGEDDSEAEAAERMVSSRMHYSAS
jgi:hypothetical protein